MKHPLPPGWSLEPLESLVREVRASATPMIGAAYELWSVPSFADGRPERLLGEQIGSVKRAVAPGDLLLCKINPRINRVWVVGPMPIDATQVASPEWIVLRMARPDVDGQFLLHFLRSPVFRRRIEGSVHGVTGSHTRARVPDVMASTVPVPPLDEQRRIVDILEDHLSRLDAADAYLAASERRLASLLASLRSGAYRFEVNRTLLADVAEVQGGILKNASRSPHENTAPFLRVANVTKGGLVLDEVHRIEVFTGERERYRLQAGDLLVVEGNGSPSQIGRAALWDGSIPDAVHQNHLIRVRPRECLLPGFLELIWNSPENRERLTRLSSSSSGLHTLSTGKLRSLDIPVPSLERQAAFVTRADDLRDEVRRTSSAVVQAASRCIALRRALLHAAFTGRLTGHASDTDRAEELAATSS